MPFFRPALALLLLVWMTAGGGRKKQAVVMVAADGTITWCIARSNVLDTTLQTALDYACGAGADCAPLTPNGLCYLPNTMQAHASYAMNSYYQRKAKASGSCDFGGTAVVAMTDPSYGSCVYPSSMSAAGGASQTTPGTTTVPPVTTTGTMPTTPIYNPNNSPTIAGTGGGLSTPGINTPTASSAISRIGSPGVSSLFHLRLPLFLFLLL